MSSKQPSSAPTARTATLIGSSGSAAACLRGARRQARPSGAGRRVSRRSAFWLPLISLWWREIVRFIRQRSRVVGYLGSPLVFWLVIGSGFGRSFQSPASGAGMNYLEYFFPGTLVLIILFTSIFGMMTVIEDRNEGFLRSVLVSPIARSSLVMGKVLGTATLATLQGLIFALLAPLAGIHLSPASFSQVAGLLFLIALGLTNLGFFVAWRLDSTHGFHALVNLFLIPMWLLSGALFPLSGAASWIGWAMRLNPLTYSVAALRRAFYSASPASLGDIPSMGLALIITAIFAGLTFLAALRIVGRHGAGNI